MKRFLAALATALSLGAFVVTAASAPAPAPKPPVITAVYVHLDGNSDDINTLDILGTGFNDGTGVITVTLAGTQYPTSVIGLFSDTMVKVRLSPLPIPGDYAVMLRNRNGSATYHLTIGAVGPKGEKGDTGPAGPEGPAGTPGSTGLPGADGAMGPAGPAGPEGPMGPQGLPGINGATGARGQIGPMGPVGPQGEIGPVGPSGPMGPQGPQGERGPQGEAGPQGKAGNLALAGMRCPAGQFVTGFSESGTLECAAPDTSGGGGGAFPPPAEGRVLLTFSAPIASASGPYASASGVVTGEVVFDASATDLLPNDSDKGRYAQMGPGYYLRVNVPGFGTPTFDPSQFIVEVERNSSANNSKGLVRFGICEPLTGPSYCYSFAIFLKEALPSDAVPGLSLLNDPSRIHATSFSVLESPSSGAPWLMAPSANFAFEPMSGGTDIDGDGYDTATDCNDADPSIHPGADEVCDDGIDNNCNGNIDEECGIDADHDRFSPPEDCDDNNPRVNPTAYEECDGIDNDCNGLIDESCGGGTDKDQDGFTPPADCNDDDPYINPGAMEVCDGLDNNCNGVVDDGCGGTDNDGDGYDAGVDCNDADPAINPGAPEICDGADNDCNGEVDELDPALYAPCDGSDADACDEGAMVCNGGVLSCSDTTSDTDEVCGDGFDNDCDGFVDEGCGSGPTDNDGDGSNTPEDCDDTNARVYPGAEELCDRIDNNCDGVVDEGCGGGTDNDGDGYTTPADCDDANSTVYPGASEVCADGLDNDCDGIVDDGCGSDGDGDGYDTTADCNDSDPAINPGATELCDGIDNNCSGEVDEDDPALDTACDGNDADVCNEGTMICADGALSCSDTTSDTEEVCGDGVDNDCDGQVDEGCRVLVLNEVDYDQPGSDGAEFVEIHNAGSSAVALDGMAVSFVNGADGQEYARVPLSGTLVPGQFAVVASPSVAVPPTALVFRFPPQTDIIQNGSPDAVALIDAVGAQLLDALSYEGEVRMAVFAGFPAPVSLVEGRAAIVADMDSGQASLIRWPDGRDTNDATADWSISTTPTPGSPNAY